MSQPALSVQIRKLEQIFDAELFRLPLPNTSSMQVGAGQGFGVVG
nr:LysR family transcriptional regulator [Streptomyces sp. NWU339]